MGDFQNKSDRSSLFDEGWENLRGRIGDVLKGFMWNLEYPAFDPGQHHLSEC